MARRIGGTGYVAEAHYKQWQPQSRDHRHRRTFSRTRDDRLGCFASERFRSSSNQVSSSLRGCRALM